MGNELDLTGLELDDDDIDLLHRALEEMRIFHTEEAVTRDEYSHGIFLTGGHNGKRLDSGYCGIARLGGRVALTGSSCLQTTFAHEIGHNLSLGHPAAGMGRFALYPDGDIGTERGWRFSDRQQIKGEHIDNLMKTGTVSRHETVPVFMRLSKVSTLTIS